MAEITRESVLEDASSSKISRKHLLTGAAAAAATFGFVPGIAHAGGMSTAAGMTESPQTILDLASTAEAAAVTALYHVHQSVNAGTFNVNGIGVPVATLVKAVRAALREEQDHYAFLIGAGAKPVTLSFTFPSAILHSAVDALRFLDVAENIFIAAYMAANREFAAGGMATLAQYSFQIGGTECEHRAVVRAALGQIPNNKSFETNMYQTVGQAAGVLEKLGILKPGLRYPGAKAVDHILSSSGDHRVTAGVIQRHP